MCGGQTMVNKELELIAQTFNSTQHVSNPAIALSMLRAGGYELEDLAKYFIGERYIPKNEQEISIYIHDATVVVREELKSINKWSYIIIKHRFIIIPSPVSFSAKKVDFASLKSSLINMVCKIIKTYETSTT